MLSELSTLASQVHFLHEERKQLVGQLQAQRSKLLNEELEDHDGLGTLFANRETNDEKSRKMAADDRNFGLGTTAASVSTLMALTTSVNNAKLKPYYSPKRRISEEHYYELYSFVAVQALSRFVGPSHVAWAVRCSHTAERLRTVREWMRCHVASLQEQLMKEHRAEDN